MNSPARKLIQREQWQKYIPTDSSKDRSTVKKVKTMICFEVSALICFSTSFGHLPFMALVLEYFILKHFSTEQFLCSYVFFVLYSPPPHYFVKEVC